MNRLFFKVFYTKVKFCIATRKSHRRMRPYLVRHSHSCIIGVNVANQRLYGLMIREVVKLENHAITRKFVIVRTTDRGEGARDKGQVARDKGQGAIGKRQEARGKGQGARGNGQGARGKGQRTRRTKV